MQPQLQQYRTTIQAQTKKYHQIGLQIKQEFLKIVAQQAETSFQTHMQLFNKHQKNFHRELQHIDYYIQNEKPNHKCKIMTLFTQIDSKMAYNVDYLTTFETVLCYPPAKSALDIEEVKAKMLIYENCFQALQKIIMGSPQLVKYCKKQTQLMESYIKKCRKLVLEYKANEWKVAKQVSIRGNVEDICNMLAQSQFPESLKISIKTDKGVMTNEDYSKLADAIYLKKRYMKELRLGLFDMQFYQQKCDILKRRLTRMPDLEQVQISNYYVQCKLGQFTDFNWYPYRKKVNITTSKLF